MPRVRWIGPEVEISSKIKRREIHQAQRDYRDWHRGEIRVDIRETDYRIARARTSAAHRYLSQTGVHAVNLKDVGVPDRIDLTLSGDIDYKRLSHAHWKIPKRISRPSSAARHPIETSETTPPHSPVPAQSSPVFDPFWQLEEDKSGDLPIEEEESGGESVNVLAPCRLRILSFRQSRPVGCVRMAGRLPQLTMQTR
jgi:hypothetical protein